MTNVEKPDGISYPKMLDLVEKKFIYRTTIDPESYNLRDTYFNLTTSDMKTLISGVPDTSLLDKPFKVTVIFEPVDRGSE